MVEGCVEAFVSEPMKLTLVSSDVAKERPHANSDTSIGSDASSSETDEDKELGAPMSGMSEMEKWWFSTPIFEEALKICDAPEKASPLNVFDLKNVILTTAFVTSKEGVTDVLIDKFTEHMMHHHANLPREDAIFWMRFLQEISESTEGLPVVPFPGLLAGKGAPMGFLLPFFGKGKGATMAPFDPFCSKGKGATMAPCDPFSSKGKGAKMAPCDPFSSKGKGATIAPCDPFSSKGKGAKMAPCDPFSSKGKGATMAPCDPFSSKCKGAKMAPCDPFSSKGKGATMAPCDPFSSKGKGAKMAPCDPFSSNGKGSKAKTFTVPSAPQNCVVGESSGKSVWAPCAGQAKGCFPGGK